MVTHTFHSLSWGVMVKHRQTICSFSTLSVYNGSETELPVDLNIDMTRVMGVFLAQLRSVLVCFHQHRPVRSPVIQLGIKRPSMSGDVGRGNWPLGETALRTAKEWKYLPLMLKVEYLNVV